MTDAASADSSTTVTPGQRLRTARKQANLDLRQVADKLHLLPRQIEALEQDNYGLFNSAVFCKGYIRSYGKLLGLDIDELLAGYTQLLPANMWPDEGLKIAPPHAQLQSSHRMTYIISAAAVIAVISLLWLFTPEVIEPSAAAEREVVIDDRDTSALTTLGGAEKQPQLASRIGLVQSAALQVSDAQPPAIADNTAIKPMFEATTPATTAFASGSPNQTTESYAITAGSDSATSLAETVEGLLTFQFSGDCWVEVKDSNDRVLYADLKRAQETLRLSGSAPFRVLLGYAPAVSLDFNGEPVSIAVNRNNNSARFVVGNL